MAAEGLTEREKQVLEHLRQAQSLGVSIKEYAEAYSLDVKDLYNGKAQLTRKGVLGPKTERVEFLAVDVGAPPTGLACRIAHPSGWTIDCAGLPDVAWLQALLRPAP